MMKARIVALLALLILFTPWRAGHVVLAQQAPTETSEYEPTVGQPGKDVVWVPTPDALVERMLQMANVDPTDYVIDLGSGDGRTVIMAAEKFRARALGIEYNADMVELSIRNAELAGVAHKAKFINADIFETDFSQATVITMYLLPSLNLKLRPQILDMPPGTRVVSHAFDMADWEPDQKITVEGRNAYLWIVPADVDGTWRLNFPEGSGDESWSVRFVQDFQMLYGQLHLPDGSYRLLDGRIRGAEIDFHFTDSSGVRHEVSGRAAGGRLEGTLQSQDGTSQSWSAVREGAGESILEIDLSY